MTTEPNILTDEQIDALLDCVLRASGSGLRNYTMQKTLDDMREATRAIEQVILQSDEIQQLRRDAKRYRWLRSLDPEADLIIEDMYECALCCEDLDAAIGAAMEKQV